MRESFRCADSGAVLIPVTEIAPPHGRKLNEESLRNVLRGIANDSIFPEPALVFRPSGQTTAHLTHGMHRFRAAQALGLRCLPCIELEEWEVAQETLAAIRSNASADSTTGDTRGAT